MPVSFAAELGASLTRLLSVPTISGAKPASGKDCTELLDAFRLTLEARDAELLRCYRPEVLRNFVFATRGYSFQKAEHTRVF